MSRKEYVGPFGPLLWALDRREGLTGTTWAVLVAIAKHSDPKGCCHPSMTTLAEVACIAERTVKAAVADLETLGYLRIARGNGRGHKSNYRLPFNLPAQRFTGPESGNGKDATAAPFSAAKDEPRAPFRKPERVQNLQIKGEPNAPELLKEESTKRQAMKNSEGEGGRSPAPVPPAPLPQPASAPAEDRAPRVRPGVVRQVVRAAARCVDARPRPDDPRSVAEQRSMLFPIPGGRPPAQEPSDTPAGQIRKLGLPPDVEAVMLAALPAEAVA